MKMVKGGTRKAAWWCCNSSAIYSGQGLCRRSPGSMDALFFLCTIYCLFLSVLQLGFDITQHEPLPGNIQPALRPYNVGVRRTHSLQWCFSSCFNGLQGFTLKGWSATFLQNRFCVIVEKQTLPSINPVPVLMWKKHKCHSLKTTRLQKVPSPPSAVRWPHIHMPRMGKMTHTLPLHYEIIFLLCPSVQWSSKDRILQMEERRPSVCLVQDLLLDLQCQLNSGVTQHSMWVAKQNQEEGTSKQSGQD